MCEIDGRQGGGVAIANRLLPLAVLGRFFVYRRESADLTYGVPAFWSHAVAAPATALHQEQPPPNPRFSLRLT